MLLEPSWSENGKSYASLEILFKEKDSFNPLNGTTLKKNYRSRLRIFQIDGQNSAKQTWESDVFDSWILPTSLYYHEKTGRIFFLKGSDDEYGTMKREAYILQFGEKKPKLITVKKSSTESILFAIPSPDGEKLAVGIAAYQEEILKDAKIQLFSLVETSTHTKEIGFWSDFSPDYLLTWSVDSNFVYIKQSNQVRVVSLEKGTLSSAKQFPLCFVGTLFGVDYSILGYGTEWSKDGKTFKILPGKQKSSPNKEMTDKIEKISGCR